MDAPDAGLYQGQFAGADTELTNSEGRTALHIATNKGFHEIVQLLNDKFGYIKATRSDEPAQRLTVIKTPDYK